MRHAEACISYWLPRLVRASVPVPQTRIVHWPGLPHALADLLDGKTPERYARFRADLHTAVAELGGYPAFLRTGHGSAKHQWDQTCFLQKVSDIGSHVARLVEWCLTVDMMGLPYEVWAVRQLLPLLHAFTAFDGLPIACERRYFVEGGRVLSHMPYWPADAVAEGNPDWADWRSDLETLNRVCKDEDILHILSMEVSRNFDGPWSLDWARDVYGQWWALDMAPAELSWGWQSGNAPPDEVFDPGIIKEGMPHA